MDWEPQIVDLGFNDYLCFLEHHRKQLLIILSIKGSFSAQVLPIPNLEYCQDYSSWGNHVQQQKEWK